MGISVERHEGRAEPLDTAWREEKSVERREDEEEVDLLASLEGAAEFIPK